MAKPVLLSVRTAKADFDYSHYKAEMGIRPYGNRKDAFLWEQKN